MRRVVVRAVSSSYELVTQTRAENLARREAGSECRRLVRKRRREHEVAILQRLLRLLRKALRLVVLRLRVGIQLSVVDTAQISSRARKLVAGVTFRGSITARGIGTQFAWRLRRGRRRGRRCRSGRRRFRTFGLSTSRGGSRRCPGCRRDRRGRWAFRLGRRRGHRFLDRCKHALRRRRHVQWRTRWGAGLRFGAADGCCGANPKTQNPNPKSQSHPKSQRLPVQPSFGIWVLGFGIWDLHFQISFARGSKTRNVVPRFLVDSTSMSPS